MPGPPPTPTAVLALRGSWRAKTRPHEPRAAPGAVPAMPDWLSADAQAVWHALVPQLAALGILAPIDAWPLARYCLLFTRWRHLGETVQRYGDHVNCRRIERTWRQTGDALHKLEKSFGMTPSARAALGIALSQAPRE